MDFLFPRRIARMPYLVRSVALTVAITLLVDHLQSGERSKGAIFVVAVIVTLVAYWTIFVVVPRCRDLAMSGWLALLALVPGVDLFFCGYLAWGRSKVRSECDGIGAIAEVPITREEHRETKSDSLRRLEALRDEGVLSEQDFLRRKARLGKNG